MTFLGATSRAQPKKDLAIWRIDALGGLSKEIVVSLESLLTKELGRLAGEIIPSAKTRALQKRYRRLRSCQGANRCLAKLGRRLRVDYVVAGNLASLGENYVVTLKLVDSSTGKAVRRISEPLSGQAERLIEAVRVAAYRLLAPERLLGSIRVVVDQPGARIHIDGEAIGKTPHRRAVTGLKVGEHLVKITHPEFLDFARKVRVRFQKTTTVKVNLLRPKADPALSAPNVKEPAVRDTPVPFYSKWWFWTAVAVGAAAVGATVGWAVGRELRPEPPTVINCDDGGCLSGGRR